jgi:hypothetical protein
MSLDLEQPAPVLDSAATVDPAALPETDLEPTDPELETKPPEDEELEEELDGVKLRGKKEALEKIKAERLMQADYTRKTQDVAETRKSLEAERAQFQQNAQLHQQYQRELAQVYSIDERLAQFQQVNWQALTDQDPVQALKLHTEFTQLQAHKGQLVNALTQKQQAQAQEQQRNTARQLMEARQVLERDIKGWSPELAAKLTDHGVAMGIPREVLDTITQPAIVKLIHDSYTLKQLEKQRAKPPAQPAPPVTRLTGGNAASAKEPASMSDAEFAAWRKRQIAQRP